MQQMSTFNKDQCVRMLEALIENKSEGGENKALKLKLYEKFFEQLKLHSEHLNSYSICRALASLEQLAKDESKV